MSTLFVTHHNAFQQVGNDIIAVGSRVDAAVAHPPVNLFYQEQRTIRVCESGPYRVSIEVGQALAVKPATAVPSRIAANGHRPHRAHHKELRVFSLRANLDVPTAHILRNTPCFFSNFVRMLALRIHRSHP